MKLLDLFAKASVRRLARDEASYAIREKGDGAVEYLKFRAQRTRDLQRRQMYRIAASMVPSISPKGRQKDDETG